MKIMTKDMVATKTLLRFTGSAFLDWFAGSPHRYSSQPELATRMHTLHEWAEANADALYDDMMAAGWEDWRLGMPKCDQCKAEDLRDVVEMGQEPNYESSTAWLCRVCLEAGIAMLEDEAKKR